MKLNKTPTYSILVEANTKGQTVNLRLANDLASDLFVAHPLFRKDPSWVQKNLADLLVLAGNKRKELLAKIATFDDATLKAFIGDLGRKEELIDVFAKNIDFVKAWEDLYNFPNLRITPIHLEAYHAFKATNNVTPRVTKDEIIEALNDLGNETNQAFYLKHLDEFNKGNRNWGHVDFEGGNFNGHLADYFRVRVSNQSVREGVGVAFMQNNILEFHLLIPSSLQQQKLGTFIFKRSISEFNPSKVKGNWKTANVYDGGESINLTIFKQKLAEGFTAERAAFETPTGRILKRNGFGGTPIIITNTDDEVVIHFNPG